MMFIKKPMYLAVKLSESKEWGELFAKPFMLCLNVQPVSGDTDIMQYGERISKMQKVVLPMYVWLSEIKRHISLIKRDYPQYIKESYDCLFKEGDRAYLDRLVPKEEPAEDGTYLCTDCNYKVVSVREQNLAIVIYFEKI